jgi:DNA-binding transcriptional regulator LsrR (DeoR family)
MTAEDTAPEQARIRIAWLYYIEGLTQERIGRALGLTRARVNRLLGECRERGVVKFQIDSKLARAVELERALVKRFGLAGAVGAPRPVDEDDLPDLVGKAAADFLPGCLRPGQSLGIGWGKTMHAASLALGSGSVRGLKIVSMFGGLPRSATINPYDIASRVAHVLGAECYFLNAPMVGSTGASTRALTHHHLLQESFKRMLSVDLAMISVGHLGASSTNAEFGLITEGTRRGLLAAGAVGDIFGYYVDARGRAVAHAANRMVVMPPLEKLCRIPRLILVSGGTKKVPILRAALATGRIDTLVTDETAAAQLVSSTPEPVRKR